MEHVTEADEAGPVVPRCTVVMPAYNAVEHIGVAIESVRSQSFGNWELVVVDDGSTDGTADVAAAVEDNRIRCLRQENQGPAAARNAGIDAARADVVTFLDADDLLLPETLERHLEVLSERPEAVAAYGEAMIIAPDGTRSGGQPVFHKRPSGKVIEELLCQNFVLCGTIAVRRDAIEAAGRFNTELRLFEDWEYWCRIAAQGEFAYLGERPVLAYRHHGDASLSRRGDLAEEGMRAVDAAFSNPQIAMALPMETLDRCLKRAEASVYRFAATRSLQAHDWTKARAALRQCLRREPVRPREWILLACALIRRLPPWVARRLK